jgi:glutathione reductase (NADPH)
VQAGDALLEGSYVHIAAGARPRPLDIEGEQLVTSSARFLYLEKLPRKILFIGGGYISFEFAHLAARCGSEAIIMHRSSAVLRKFDPDLVSKLLEASEKTGITVVLNEAPERVIQDKQGLRVITNTENGEKEYCVDMVVHGAGRIPDIAGLNLQAAGIEASPEGIVVNAHMQSISNDHVYAAGDVAAGTVPLTPVAMREGRIVADNLVRGMKRARPDYSSVPSVVFSLPQLASAGIHEAEASRQDRDFNVVFRETSRWLHNERVQEKFAASKIIIEKGTEKILGAHILDSHADDLINLFALAMQHGLSKSQIQDVLYAYPSASSSIQYMVE